VVYGPDVESTPIAIDRRVLQRLFSTITRSSHIALSIEDNGNQRELDVFVKAIQYDPITDEPVHVDFYHPVLGHPLKLDVPVKVVGEAPGVKSGGILNILFHTIPVHGLPKDIPPLLTIDVSNLSLGEGIRIRDMDLGEVEPLLAPERAIVTVLSPHRVEEEEGEAEEAELLIGEAGEAAGETTEETPAEGE